MPKHSRDDPEQTRHLLLDAAEDVFLKRGVKAASLEEIARTAGLTRGAVYWHFQNKSDLFDAMHERSSLPFEDAFNHAETMADNPLTALQHACVSMLYGLMQNDRMRRVFTIMLFRCEYTTEDTSADDRMNGCRREALEQCTRTFARAQALGLLRATVTPEQAGLGLIALMGGLFQECLNHAQDYTLPQTYTNTLEIFFIGLRA